MTTVTGNQYKIIQAKTKYGSDWFWNGLHGRERETNI